MNMRIKTAAQYEEWYKNAKENPEDFWGEMAQNFSWRRRWEKVQEGDFNSLDIKWFQAGQLNITENCLDRHLKDKADQVAVIFEANDPNEPARNITYKELFEKVCKMANVLKNHGVQKGDRVCLYMGMIPELLISVLACARIGAVHSVVFGGFSNQSLAMRINDCGAKLLITCDGSPRGKKQVLLKDIADSALKDCPNVENVLVFKRIEIEVAMKEGRDHWANPLIDEASSECAPEIMDAEDPLFILYSSGSTGKPKGLMHTCGGYMVWAGFTFNNVFQMEKDDIFWCTADIGWITGHSYIAYGPLLNGATQVMFEGIPTYPDPGRFWKVIDKYKVTHFYTAPTAIRHLEGFGLEYVNKRDLSSLKVLGSVGEPINEEAWNWYSKHIGNGKCPIVDTWWQTETGGIMISALAGVTKDKATYTTKPLPGVIMSLVDHEGKELEGESEGNLCIKKPWPGIARTIWGNPERYKETYFSTYPGLYFTGDGAKRDSEGNFRITGRVDDLINVSGHLLGTAEIEDALNQHKEVVESAVVGYPHNIKGSGIYAYVILDQNQEHENPEDLNKELSNMVGTILGPICKPDKIQIVPALPKTRSGKIMRRILRKVASNKFDDLGDTSTLLNPEVVDELIKHKI
ncbi:MAG: acetate--CoA ligase [Epsilonproteobacteria bacterium]|nr:MAG: acetate--CoA ligase [Campylobacterota bacterium]